LQFFTIKSLIKTPRRKNQRSQIWRTRGPRNMSPCLSRKPRVRQDKCSDASSNRETIPTGIRHKTRCLKALPVSLRRLSQSITDV
jgi:hypothetical protein